LLNAWTGLVEPLAMRLPLPLAPRQPVAIIGFGRSGKSLLSRALQRSGAFARYPTEGNLRLFMPNLYPWRSSRIDVPPLWYDPRPTRSYLETLYAGSHGRRIRGTVGLYQKLTGKRVLVDNGRVIFWLDAFLGVFPDAQLLAVLRDPRDAVPIVAAKARRKMRQDARYRQVPDLTDADVTARMVARWIECWQIMTRLERANRAKIVRFELLCQVPGETLAGLFDALDRSDIRALPPIMPREAPSNAERAEVEGLLEQTLSAKDYCQLEEEWGEAR
jgi:hypothetical protein